MRQPRRHPETIGGRDRAHAGRGVDDNAVPAQTLLDRGEVALSGRFDLPGEVLGNTAALAETPGGSGGESTLTPEIGGSEVVGMLGVRYHPNPKIAGYLSVCYDNNQAVLVRPGITLALR
jgi:hypothetical protein